MGNVKNVPNSPHVVLLTFWQICWPAGVWRYLFNAPLTISSVTIKIGSATVTALELPESDRLQLQLMRTNPLGCEETQMSIYLCVFDKFPRHNSFKIGWIFPMNFWGDVFRKWIGVGFAMIKKLLFRNSVNGVKLYKSRVSELLHDSCLPQKVTWVHHALFELLNRHLVFVVPLALEHAAKLSGANLTDERQIFPWNFPFVPVAQSLGEWCALNGLHRRRELKIWTKFNAE